MENIIIIGSGGHAKVIIDIVQQEGKYNIVGLLDRKQGLLGPNLGYQVLGKEEDLPELLNVHDVKGILVAVGDNFVRSKVVELVRELCPELPFVSAVHPKAAIGTDVSINEGTVVMAGVSINPGSSIGKFCILNTNSSLDHDSVMGDFSSLAPGVTVGGECKIGEFTAVGIRAVLLHGIQVGAHTVIGASALVMKPVESKVVAYGIPAKVIRKRKPGDKYL